MAEPLIYNPDVFRPHSMEQARRIILTSQESTSEERWRKETPFLVDVILREMQIRTTDLILDYGCGIGRIAKELCAKGAQVIGIDISPEMRQYAMEYVDMPGKFIAVSPEEFDLLVAHGLRVDGAYAVWVLQHCLQPQADLARIYNACKPQANFFVANNRKVRAVPVNRDFVWAHDSVDVWGLIGQLFGERCTVAYPAGLGSKPEDFLCRCYMKTSSR